MQDGDEVNIQELASNLTIYKDQLNQVRQLLNDEPSNSEYVDMERELCEVIALTEELLATAKQNEISVATESPSLSRSKENKVELDSHFDHQEKFPIGTRVQAVYSEDGEWYDATVEAYTPNGYYVSYDSWGNKEEVDPANIRPIQEGTVDALVEAERVAEATKQAIKRKIAQAGSVDFQSRSLPAKLRIEPDDPEDVKITKRKKIHAFKSKMRMEQLDDGIRGLYKGFATVLTGTIPARIVFLTFLETTKEASFKMVKPFKLSETSQAAIANGIAGMLSAVVSQVVYTPIDVISQKLMVQGYSGHAQYSGGLDVARKLIRFLEDDVKSEEATPSLAKIVLVQAGGGLIAGATASCITTPLDTIKTRLQVTGHGKKISVKQVVKDLIREDGWKGVYRGFCPRLISTSAWGTSMVLAYEYLKRLCVKKDEEAAG